MLALIRDIAFHLPDREILNVDLERENPSWDMPTAVLRSGVLKRHIAGPGETSLDLATQACRRLLEKNSDLADKVDAILFCTQSPDYVMPPNACLLHKSLKFSENVFCLDFNLACSGYVYGLSLARGLISSKQASNILLVTADTYSRYIHPQDRSTRILFGDGAAATWISNEKPGSEIVDILCATSGEFSDKFMIPAGGCRLPRNEKTGEPQRDSNGNVRTQEHIHMDGMSILGFVNSRVPEQIRELCRRNQLALEQIDFFLFHQASKAALESLISIMEIPAEKVFFNLEQIGNTVSASIPIAFNEARAAGKIQRGQKIILSGFGVGLSWASALITS